MKKLIAILLVFAMCFTMFVGCGSDKPIEGTKSPGSSESSESPKDGTDYKVRLVLPATDSQFWTVNIAVGVQNAILDAQEKYNIDIDYLFMAPVSETETDAFLDTLETAISQKPDIMMLSTLIPDATTPLVREANDQGIRVHVYDLTPPDCEECYITNWVVTQEQQGYMAAEKFYEVLVDKGLPLDGTVGVFMSVLVPDLEVKIDCFKERLLELAPDLVILDTEYNENDMNKGIAQVEATIGTYGSKLVGCFGANNTSGTAIANAYKASGIDPSTYACIVTDADDAEVEALREGYIDGIVMMPTYTLVYDQMMAAIDNMINGTEYTKWMDYKCTMITRDIIDNLDETTYSDLYPAEFIRDK